VTPIDAAVSRDIRWRDTNEIGKSNPNWNF